MKIVELFTVYKTYYNHIVDLKIKFFFKLSNRPVPPTAHGDQIQGHPVQIVNIFAKQRLYKDTSLKVKTQSSPPFLDEDHIQGHPVQIVRRVFSFFWWGGGNGSDSIHVGLHQPRP